jgi:hypothetical protein
MMPETPRLRLFAGPNGSGKIWEWLGFGIAGIGLGDQDLDNEFE